MNPDPVAAWEPPKRNGPVDPSWLPRVARMATTDGAVRA